jgi:fluoroquinolone transport system permease protein
VSRRRPVSKRISVSGRMVSERTPVFKWSLLVRADFRHVLRDEMLLFALCGPVILTVLLSFGFPAVQAWVQATWAVDIGVYASFVLSFFMLLTPLILGMIAGFIMLDERDEGVLHYYAITPLKKSGYVLYRLTVPVGFGFLLTGGMYVFSGLAADFSWRIVPVLLLLATFTPMLALFLSAFAHNKVEGIALAKACGVLFLAPVAAYFFSSGWSYLAGILPPFWAAKAFLAVDEPVLLFGLYVLLGFLSSGGVLYVLYRRFEKMMD